MTEMSAEKTVEVARAKADELPESVTEFPEPERLLLHMPVDVRNLSLVVLAILASLFVLQWARAVFIPIMLSVLFSYAFSPLINWLEIKRVPRWLSSAVLLLGLLGAMLLGAYSLRVEAGQLVEALPAAAQKLGQALKSSPGKTDSALETVQKAAARLSRPRATVRPRPARIGARPVW